MLSMHIPFVEQIRRPPLGVRRTSPLVNSYHEHWNQRQQQGIMTNIATLGESFFWSLSHLNTSKIPQADRACAICLHEYQTCSIEDYSLQDPREISQEETRELPTELPCGHHFGHVCCFRWLSAHNTCPLCRSVLFELPPDTRTNSVLEERMRHAEERMRYAQERRRHAEERRQHIEQMLRSLEPFRPLAEEIMRSLDLGGASLRYPSEGRSWGARSSRILVLLETVSRGNVDWWVSNLMYNWGLFFFGAFLHAKISVNSTYLLIYFLFRRQLRTYWLLSVSCSEGLLMCEQRNNTYTDSTVYSKV